MNLAEALEHHARARPESIAVIAGDLQVDHCAFRNQVIAAAAALNAQGVQTGARIGVALRDTPEHLVVMFALARLGAIMVPLDHRWTTVERAELVEHFAIQRVLADDEFAAALAAPVATHAAPPIAPGDAAALLLSLSSGTTGRPKGPLLSHAQFLARFRTHSINLGLNAQHRYVAATPLYFGGGRTFAMSVLFAGGTVILCPPPMAISALAAAIERTGATSTFLVPTQLRQLLDAPAAVRACLRNLRLLIASGAPLSGAERGAISAKLCARFYDYYASTEGGGITLLAPEDQAMHPDSVGRAIFGVEIEVVDDEDRPVPAGTLGRLRYRGPGCATEFDQDHEATARAFRDGWFYPGDLATRSGDGFVTLNGRADDVIIRGGVNIYPSEIETVLTSHPALADAAVVGITHATLGEEVAAGVVARSAITAAELIQWCGARLAPYKVPTRWRVMAALPRNAGGKVVRATLRDMFSAAQ